jgi:hypothetical protein
MNWDAVTKTAAQILTQDSAGRNQGTGCEAETDDEGSNDYEAAYRNHRRATPVPDRLYAPNIRRRVVRHLQCESANGHGGRRSADRQRDSTHNLPLGRDRAITFHGIAWGTTPDLSPIAGLVLGLRSAQLPGPHQKQGLNNTKRKELENEKAKT